MVSTATRIGQDPNRVCVMKIRVASSSSQARDPDPRILLGIPIVVGAILGAGIARAVIQRSPAFAALFLMVGLVEATYVVVVGLATATSRLRLTLIACGSIVAGLLVGFAAWQ